MPQLEENKFYIFTLVLEVLFKANLLKEKRWDQKFCYNTIISYDTLHDFPYLTTFEFVNRSN